MGIAITLFTCSSLFYLEMLRRSSQLFRKVLTLLHMFGSTAVLIVNFLVKVRWISYFTSEEEKRSFCLDRFNDMCAKAIDIRTVTFKLATLGLMLTSCSHQSMRSPEDKLEKICALSQITGAYSTSSSLTSRTVLFLLPDSTFQLFKASDVGQEEENKGRYTISNCSVELKAEPFNGQENYLVILGEIFFVYKQGDSFYLVPKKDTGAFLKAFINEVSVLDSLTDGNVLLKINK